MAVDIFMKISDVPQGTLQYAPQTTVPGYTGIWQIPSFSFSIENAVSLSQSSAGGAGRVVLNPFTFTRPVDALSIYLFQKACSGTALSSVQILLQKSTGGNSSAQAHVYRTITLKQVFVKTYSIGTSDGDEAEMETVSLVYGSIAQTYTPQNTDGSISSTPLIKGWDAVKNQEDDTVLPPS